MFVFNLGIFCDEKGMGFGVVIVVIGFFQGWKFLLSDELLRGEGYLFNLLYCVVNIVSGVFLMWQGF